MSGTLSKAREIFPVGECLDVVSLLPHRTSHLSPCKFATTRNEWNSSLMENVRYIFGGSSNDTESSDGNVYVLSIPSFQWIQLEGSNALRIKHKCQLAGQHTMLVVGGTVPMDGNEYEPSQANCDSDIFENGIGIFDLNKHQWNTNYDADDDKYTIHSSISDVIGGGYLKRSSPFLQRSLVANASLYLEKLAVPPRQNPKKDGTAPIWPMCLKTSTWFRLAIKQHPTAQIHPPPAHPRPTRTLALFPKVALRALPLVQWLVLPLLEGLRSSWSPISDAAMRKKIPPLMSLSKRSRVGLNFMVKTGLSNWRRLGRVLLSLRCRMIRLAKDSSSCSARNFRRIRIGCQRWMARRLGINKRLVLPHTVIIRYGCTP